MEINQQKRVLVADDNDGVRESMRDILETMGYSVAVVSNGHEAIERCREVSYDFVVLDVDTPVVSGDKACKVIMSEGNCHCVFLMTGRRQPDDLIQASGAFGFLSKPFRINELLVQVDRCLELAA